MYRIGFGDVGSSIIATPIVDERLMASRLSLARSSPRAVMSLHLL